MGLFGKKKDEQVEFNDNNAAVNPVAENNQETTESSNNSLQNLMNDFKNMGSSIEEPIETDQVDESLEDGIRYNTSPEENKQIENYLTGEEEPMESNEEVGDSLEELVDEDDDEIVDDEEVIGEDGDEIVDDDEIIDEDSDEIVDDDEVVDEDSDEIVDDDEVVDEDEDEIVENETIDLDSKSEKKNLNDEELEFYKKLVAKYEKEKKSKDKRSTEKKTTKSKPAKKTATKNKKTTKKTDSKASNKEKEIENITVIDDVIFRGDVVAFTPLREVKKASWEDVVRRKGHYAYHVTASDNGGWFIKRAGKPNPYAYAKRKDEVMRLAKMYAEREKAELKIHNEKGVIEKSFSFGREKLRG